VGTHTTCASRMLENYDSTFTATCVARMLAAGATPMGKANMDEFAFGSSTESSAFHRTNNPWDTDACPAGPRAAPLRPSPPARSRSPWGRTRAAPFDSQPRSVASWE